MRQQSPQTRRGGHLEAAPSTAALEGQEDCCSLSSEHEGLAAWPRRRESPAPRGRALLCHVPLLLHLQALGPPSSNELFWSGRRPRLWSSGPTSPSAADVTAWQPRRGAPPTDPAALQAWQALVCPLGPGNSPYVVLYQVTSQMPPRSEPSTTGPGHLAPTISSSSIQSVHTVPGAGLKL